MQRSSPPVWPQSCLPTEISVCTDYPLHPPSRGRSRLSSHVYWFLLAFVSFPFCFSSFSWLMLSVCVVPGIPRVRVDERDDRIFRRGNPLFEYILSFSFITMGVVGVNIGTLVADGRRSVYDPIYHPMAARRHRIKTRFSIRGQRSGRTNNHNPAQRKKRTLR
jgi:hypothetical protein